MCERTCPRCGSTEHGMGYGLIGTHIQCEHCLLILANRRDIEAAETHLTEAEAKAWQAEGSFVVIGGEAKDPADDEMFGPQRVPVHEQEF